jgi:hypothetical protein
LRRALVVGIDDYPSSQLGGCVADADAVATLLERHENGTKNFDVRTMTGPPDAITRVSLRAAIVQLFARPADVALFYFAGHGTENDLDGYLVTRDATAYDEGVSMSEVIRLANRSPVSERIVVVDCCHSGHLGNDPLGPRDANAKAKLSEGVSVLAASRSTEPAMEASGRGLFTTLLCSALDGGAADVLGDTKIAAVYSYIDESLGPWQQRPLFKAHLTSSLSLRKGDPSLPLAGLRRIVGLFPTQGGELTLDPSFERTHSSADPVNVEIFELLVAYRDARLVEVVTHPHLYYAALESGRVRLTPLGRHYWRLVAEGRL